MRPIQRNLCKCIIVLSALFQSYSYADENTYPIPESTKKIIYYPETFQTSDGLTMHGHLSVPAGEIPANGFPAVIMFSGSGAFNRYENIPQILTANNQPLLFFKEIEKSLVNQGIAVFLYDKRGIVPIDNSFFKNNITDKFKTADAKNLADDALKAFDYLSSLKQIDSTKISVLGHSEGTTLALKVAEQRPSVKSLFMLGMNTRSMKDTVQFQYVTGRLREFNLYNVAQDGVLTKKEYNDFVDKADNYDKKFPNQASSSFLKTNKSWDDFYKANSQLNVQDKISIQEFNFTNEQFFKKFSNKLQDMPKPWSNWLAQYFQEDAYLERQLPFCHKMHVFQGEVDANTLFEDALEIRNSCRANQTPLASFNSYPGLTHGFSPYTGYKGWRSTMGPVDPQVIKNITKEAIKDLK